jgi:hypothetical protein
MSALLHQRFKLNRFEKASTGHWAESQRVSCLTFTFNVLKATLNEIQGFSDLLDRMKCNSRSMESRRMMFFTEKGDLRFILLPILRNVFQLEGQPHLCLPE